jgi:hypothetical protein
MSEETVWEYRDYQLFIRDPLNRRPPNHPSYEEWLAGLNELGAAGWEVLGPVSLISQPGPHQVSVLLLKRHVKSEGDRLAGPL